MKNLTNTIALISRANTAAQLLAIDTEAKTCTVYNGTEKVITWVTAAQYKLSDGSGKTLTPKLLTALAADDLNAPGAGESEGAEMPVSDAEASEAIITPKDAETVAQATQEAAEQPKGKRSKKADATEVNDNEKLLLATIPTLPDFKGVDSELNGRAFVKKAEQAHGIPLNRARAGFASLKAKGYYDAKGKEAGQTRTTFQLSDLGIKYLTDNGLLSVVQ